MIGRTKAKVFKGLLHLLPHAVVHRERVVNTQVVLAGEETLLALDRQLRAHRPRTLL
jgi:hypothetical protein